MKWLYTYKEHEEVVTDEQRAAMLKIASNGSFTPIAEPITPPEAVQAEKKTQKGNPNE